MSLSTVVAGLAVSEPAPRWAGATDAERVQTRIGFIVDLIRQIDPSLDVDSVRGIVLTVVHNRLLVYGVAGHLRSSPDDLTSGRSGMPGTVADLIAKLIDAGVKGLVVPVCAQCGLNSVKSQRVADSQICRCDDASRSRCARCGDIGRPTQRQGDGCCWCDLCVQVERADVLDCSACGHRRQVRGHLPDGRPLCARCLSRGAQMGTCPGCQVDTITTITATGRLCGRCRATRTAASVDARARHAARTEVIVAAIQCVATDAPAQLIQSTLGQTAAAPITRLRLAEYLTAHPDALTSGDSAAPKALGQLIAALNLLGVTGLVPPRCAGCGKTAVLGHPADAGQRICEACHHRRHVETCGVCGRQCPVAARHLDGTARCARCCKRAGAQACGECGRVKQIARRAPDGTARCSTCVRRDPAWWDTCSVCGARRPVNTRGADGAAVCPTCYNAPSPPVTCAGAGPRSVPDAGAPSPAGTATAAGPTIADAADAMQCAAPAPTQPAAGGACTASSPTGSTNSSPVTMAASTRRGTRSDR